MLSQSISKNQDIVLSRYDVNCFLQNKLTWVALTGLKVQ